MVDRRRVLQLGAVAALTTTVLPACGTDEQAQPAPQPTPDSQQADELALIAVYDAALLSSGPRATIVYQRLRDEHVEHLAALGWQQPPPPPVDADPSRRTLMRAERRATRIRSNAAVVSPDAEQAQILALIAASEAQHVLDLEEL
jgi:hypothetical protein